MISPKSLLLFASGCIAGVLISVALANPIAKAHAAPMTAGPYADVPIGHKAAPAIIQLKSEGILVGDADNMYHGNAPVTRYELAVILARFAKYYDHSTRPLDAKIVPLPAAPAWVDPSRQYLAGHLYIARSSVIFANPGTASVTSDQLATTISSLFDRITDRTLPSSEPQ